MAKCTSFSFSYSSRAVHRARKRWDRRHLYGQIQSRTHSTRNQWFEIHGVCKGPWRNSLLSCRSWWWQRPAKRFTGREFMLQKAHWKFRRRSSARQLYPACQGMERLYFKWIYYSTFIRCTRSDFLIGWFVPRDTGLWRNNLLDVIRGVIAVV